MHLAKLDCRSCILSLDLLFFAI
ncbi:hypothetical protein CHELA1G11_21519 [Hyphomicrobiales bacterium]|nr:hypothetical protein CHELA1G11_21519 [Hyphomicrobiales bacterium]